MEEKHIKRLELEKKRKENKESLKQKANNVSKGNPKDKKVDNDESQSVSLPDAKTQQIAFHESDDSERSNVSFHSN